MSRNGSGLSIASATSLPSVGTAIATFRSEDFAVSRTAAVVATAQAGLMLWLRWKTLSGSYWAFTAASRL